ncbi:fructosamine kinase family protein [Winogradskyella aurantiaca]|uniref:fructosamine kinase family protein n=1 Tax=Winogradskyella aurantiaca TaxID=2219558 RepID=UPI000E1D4771|nr:fructosamine kinase family protein [Winogradskyella aurantiaca]
MQKSLQKYIEDRIKSSITRITPVSGGDISSAYQISLHNSQEYFVKCNSKSTALEMFQKEQQGLELIAETKSIAVPNVKSIYHDNQISAIIMDFIPSKNTDSMDMTALGKELAQMHQSSDSQYGLNTANFIGSLKQLNNQTSNWVSFYVQQRLQPQLSMATSLGLLKPSEIPSLNLMNNRINDVIVVNKPSLLHGDLWGGNYLIQCDGKPYLIDPAVYYGDKFVDIAMSQLFGGFTKDFYDSYFYWTPKVEQLEERIELYQLYYLLVHLNMFGRSYYPAVKRSLIKYF